MLFTYAKPCHSFAVPMVTACPWESKHEKRRREVSPQWIVAHAETCPQVVAMVRPSLARHLVLKSVDLFLACRHVRWPYRVFKLNLHRGLNHSLPRRRPARANASGMIVLRMKK